ncbi:MAG TPA: NADPH-dependent FMN reductase [Opitutaceae bacterium]|jgi:FMN reductase|nr:NADPH-dependent FMN reductase [Opitutaceae bacterium]
MILILSTSLRPASNSRILAQAAQRALAAAGLEARLVDLRDRPLPICDGGAAYEDPNVGVVREQIERADAILLALPIYNYDASAAAKNLVELTGSAWEDKAVGFLCAAGGPSSYMSVMSFANSLMLDFRCVIAPRFVYATGAAFAGSAIVDAEVAARVSQLALTTARLGAGLKAAAGVAAE